MSASKRKKSTVKAVREEMLAGLRSLGDFKKRQPFGFTVHDRFAKQNRKLQFSPNSARSGEGFPNGIRCKNGRRAPGVSLTARVAEVKWEYRRKAGARRIWAQGGRRGADWGVRGKLAESRGGP